MPGMPKGEPMPAPRNLQTRCVLLATLIAGSLDLTAAIANGLFMNIPPVSIMQSIASGLLGRDTYSGGAASAGLGVVLHFAIMLAFSAAYGQVSQRLPGLVRHPLIAGAVYGTAIYFFMRAIVLPLSAFPHPVTYAPGVVLKGLLIHVFCVGLPIAFVFHLAHRTFSAAKAAGGRTTA